MKRLLCLGATLAYVLPAASHAIPILTTTNCDAAGTYTCLTRIEDFEFDGQAYDADFVQGSIFDLFDVDTDVSPEELYDQFNPLEGAVFWDNPDGAKLFALALSAFMASQGIDGFLCNELRRCFLPERTFAFIPSHLQVKLGTIPPFELAGCLVGVNNNGTAFSESFCISEGAGLNWAVITPVPEPATLLLFSSALAGMALIRRRRSEYGEQEKGSEGR